MCFVRRLGYRKRNCYRMTMTCQNHPSLPLDRHLPRDYSQLPRDLDISQRNLWSFVQQQDPLQPKDPLKSQLGPFSYLNSFTSFLLNYFNRQEDAYGKSLLSEVHQGKEVFPRQQNKSRTSNPYIKLAFFWTTDDDGFQ